ncbi:hypothetical protein MLD38_019212 [Melastoma candidum]|uniref:Uncharacterized protein n=1 Tax=Melastoma candidum TaxID=119954 RepID=A0ACB9QW99_9MYRT|nr:hypothetical protein MLD38_019212 [Melastoma candidum]
MDVMGKIRDNQRANGFATILAIGTANPPDIMHQAEYPDFYFRITNSEHMTDVKEKFARISLENSSESPPT